MKWLKGLYLGSDVGKRKKRIEKEIRRRKLKEPVYLLFLQESPRLQLFFMPSWCWLQPYYQQRQDLTLIGYTLGRQEAIDLVGRLLQETLAATGQADIAPWLAGKEAGREAEDAH